jgi:bacterioferritin (cytochrome b1)
MKVKKKPSAIINELLASENTAINQLMQHSELSENWGYIKLYMAARQQAMDEMLRAEWFIEQNLKCPSSNIGLLASE